ncbi:MAG: 6-carboxytetrahydropterin synthase, partial [Candidatus Thermoplasmatota archaeon]|nr:6-carboxytetrahydropterin synthase [Candidatus Thermoplasmatota archaeon]
MQMTSRIRRWVETDTGHRVPNHKSKCRNMHGHRYRW